LPAFIAVLRILMSLRPWWMRLGNKFLSVFSN
jgi:hypothetical protein